MSVRLTPVLVIQKIQRRILTIVLLLAIMLSSGGYLFLGKPTVASNTYTWSGSDLALGANASTTSAASEVAIYREEMIETRADFFEGTVAEKSDQTFTEINDQGVILSHWSEIDGAAMPGLPVGYGSSMQLVDNLLYLGDDGYVPGGVAVIDTKGTFESGDDEFLYSYTSTSTPAIVSNQVTDVFRYENFLYVGTNNSGISVIDTKGTVTQSDDTLAGTYRTNTTPAIPNNSVISVSRSGDSLYVQTRAAILRSTITLIDTKSTDVTTDDVTLTNYTNNTYRHHKIIDGLLYILKQDGNLMVVDFAGTASTTDDVLLGSYSSTTNPQMPEYPDIAKDGGYLYMVSDVDGIRVIDTRGTASLTDDVLVVQYDDYLGWNILIDGNILLVEFKGGYLLIDTKGTITEEDDETTSYQPPLGRYVGSYLKNDSAYMSVSTYGQGPLFFDNNQHVESASYYGAPRRIQDVNTGSLNANVSLAGTQAATLRYRTGSELAVSRLEFDTTAGYAGDYYEYGSVFENVASENGVLRLTGADNVWVSGRYSTLSYWFAVGTSTQNLPVGTVFKIKARVVSDTALGLSHNQVIEDEWEYFQNSIERNEWSVFQAESGYYNNPGYIGYYFVHENGTWSPEDYLEIDWIEVVPPDSAGYWNEWQTCDSLDSCPIDLSQLSGNEWIQYAVTLATEDVLTTPTLTSVTYAGPYETTGVYTSQAETFTESQELLTFTTVDTVPASTSIAYEYSINGGLNWADINSGDSFPRGTTAGSFVWRATLSSESDLVTPVISSVSLTATDVSSSEVSSTRIQSRIEKLEQNGLSEEAAYLRKTFPDVFDENGEATTAEIQQGILSRIEKVLDLMEKLLAAKAKENNQ